jgi:hypothetical protein
MLIILLLALEFGLPSANVPWWVWVIAGLYTVWSDGTKIHHHVYTPER